MMNFISECVNAVSKVADNFLIKAMVSLILSFKVHAYLFFAFCILVFLDLISRWIAISYAMLAKNTGETVYLVDSIKAIPEAHREGLISSEIMRKQFCSKMLMYALIVLAAAIVDHELFIMHRPIMAVTLVITYLSMTELLSVVENLDEAGVSAVHELATLIKGKRR